LGRLALKATEAPMTPCTLFDALATLPDPRSRHGRVHPLPAVMGLVALALLMGRKSLKGIARFGRQYGAPLAHALGFRRGKTPTVSTLSRTLRRLDARHLEAALSRWVGGRIDPAAVEQISIDGKTLRGSRDGEVPGQHLVAAYAPAVEAVLAQVRVDAKTNEHKAALELLGILPLAGAVVVGDAMFCQRDLAQRVVDSGGDYILAVKDNQPGLEIDIQAGLAFEDAARGIAAATSP
jgi:DDE_Tnp_1-associated/Transposase DDE domain